MLLNTKFARTDHAGNASFHPNQRLPYKGTRDRTIRWRSSWRSSAHGRGVGTPGFCRLRQAEGADTFREMAGDGIYENVNRNASTRDAVHILPCPHVIQRASVLWRLVEDPRCPVWHMRTSSDRSINMAGGDKTSKQVHGNHRWHAVEIVAPKTACASAQALKGKRFLSAEAPILPLHDCALPGSCHCVYRKHSDRRDSTVRRSEDDTGIRRMPPAAQERRSRRGRRKTD